MARMLTMFNVEDEQRTLSKTASRLRTRLMEFLARRSRFLATRIGRRLDWFWAGLTPKRFMNIVSCAIHFLLKSERSGPFPLFLKIDISPACNLSCTVCVHADANGNPQLEKQQLSPKQRMSVDQYRCIIKEIRGHSLGVVLYYMGDPLVYPDLDEICRITHDAGLVSHVSTNLSFKLSDARIRSLVESGLTHLTVCVDGLSQEKYERTRVGGRIDWVIANLEKICTCRSTLKRRYPKIEVQYLKYQHNLVELPAAEQLFRRIGADQFHEVWGWLHNYTDRDPGNFTVGQPLSNARLPRCHWPHFMTLIKYNGDVIPCCVFRIGQQYTETDDARPAGNVFSTSVRSVWRGESYRKMRRLVSRPQAAVTDPTLTGTFCDECPRLFETDFEEKTCRYGNTHEFEKLYQIGVNGRPVRLRDNSAVPAPVIESRTTPVSNETEVTVGAK